MVMIALSSSLIGAVLGTHYKFLVLLPVAITGAALVAMVAVFKGLAIVAAITAIGVWVVCLQVGYMAGLLTRYCLEATGLAPQRSLHSTSTISHN
jgi:hypothetical protein